MLELVAPARSSSGLVHRRAFLRAGALALSGLAATPSLNRMDGAESKKKRDTAVILLFLSGGPSQHDTFDPKPDAKELL
jgi:uncharacterized protein (DUF1501 family)